MARFIIAPQRDEMIALGFDLRMIAYIEDIDGFNTESIEETDSIFGVLAQLTAKTGLLKAEISKIKKDIEDLDNRTA